MYSPRIRIASSFASQEGIQHARIEMLATALHQDFQAPFNRERFLVGTRRAEGIKDIGNRNDPPFDRDCVPG